MHRRCVVVCSHWFSVHLGYTAALKDISNFDTFTPLVFTPFFWVRTIEWEFSKSSPCRQPIARLMYLSRMAQHAMQDISTTWALPFPMDDAAWLCLKMGYILQNPRWLWGKRKSPSFGMWRHQGRGKTGKAFLGHQGFCSTIEKRHHHGKRQEVDENWTKFKTNKHESSHGFRRAWVSNIGLAITHTSIFVKNRWGENPCQHHEDLVEVLVSS